MTGYRELARHVRAKGVGYHQPVRHVRAKGAGYREPVGLVLAERADYRQPAWGEARWPSNVLETANIHSWYTHG